MLVHSSEVNLSRMNVHPQYLNMALSMAHGLRHVTASKQDQLERFEYHSSWDTIYGVLDYVHTQHKCYSEHQ